MATRAKSTFAKHSELSKIKHSDQSHEYGKYDISNIHLSMPLCANDLCLFYCYFATMNMIAANIVIE